MNMPIMGDGTVLFTSTLFALIRTALRIYNSGGPSRRDDELRRVIKRLWPKISVKILNRMIPRDSGFEALLFFILFCLRVRSMKL